MNHDQENRMCDNNMLINMDGSEVPCTCPVAEEKCSHGPTIGCPNCPNSTGIGYSTSPVEEKVTLKEAHDMAMKQGEESKEKWDTYLKDQALPVQGELQKEIQETCPDCGNCVNEICLKHQKALLHTQPTSDWGYVKGSKDWSWLKTVRAEYLQPETQVCRPDYVLWLIAQAKEEGRREKEEEHHKCFWDIVNQLENALEDVNTTRLATITLFEEEIAKMIKEDADGAMCAHYHVADLLAFADSLKNKV